MLNKSLSARFKGPLQRVFREPREHQSHLTVIDENSLAIFVQLLLIAQKGCKANNIYTAF
eukprot:1153661-Pelagomonas_calceolata.AAC.2